MIEDTESYYRRRCSEELGAAERATDPLAAEIHRSLAARYSALAGQPQVRAIERDGPRDLGPSQDLSSVG
jgi:hypothetical protein